MTVQGFSNTSLLGHAVDEADASMSAWGRIVLTILCFGFYCTCAILSMTFAPEPKRLEKGKWVKMPAPDYWAHYLEWVSIVHAVIALIIGTYIAYMYGYDFNRKTLYSEYVIVCNSCGYFIYDTIAEWYFETFDAGMVAHHFASIAVTGFTLYEHYGGCAMFNGLYYAEMSGPCFIFRCAMKRENVEHTFRYHITVWVYSTLYFLSRGIGYSLSLYPIARALKVPFYLKCIFIPALFLSYGWLALISSMLWKSIPNWSSNPKNIERKYWWIRGREIFQKYTKDAPMVYVTTFLIALFSCIMPLGTAYIAHHVDNSWGTYGDSN